MKEILQQAATVSRSAAGELSAQAELISHFSFSLNPTWPFFLEEVGQNQICWKSRLLPGWDCAEQTEWENPTVTEARSIFGSRARKWKCTSPSISTAISSTVCWESKHLGLFRGVRGLWIQITVKLISNHVIIIYGDPVTSTCSWMFVCCPGRPLNNIGIKLSTFWCDLLQCHESWLNMKNVWREWQNYINIHNIEVLLHPFLYLQCLIWFCFSFLEDSGGSCGFRVDTESHVSGLWFLQEPVLNRCMVCFLLLLLLLL